MNLRSIKNLTGLLMVSFVISSASYAQSNILTEPLFVRPFAKEIPSFPKACEAPVYNAVMAKSKELGFLRQGNFSGHVSEAKAYEITVNGVIYKGGRFVFQALQLYDANFVNDRYAQFRGDLNFSGTSCSVSNVRFYKHVDRRMIEE